eukprot:SAG11_NODE_765_length_7275_cov_16.594203_3_plen_64_part_00
MNRVVQMRLASAVQIRRPMSSIAVKAAKPLSPAAQFSALDSSWAVGQFAASPLTLSKTYLTGA